MSISLSEIIRKTLLPASYMVKTAFGTEVLMGHMNS